LLSFIDGSVSLLEGGLVLVDKKLRRSNAGENGRILEMNCVTKLIDVCRSVK
jgi:hypothetical protein